MQLQPHRTSQQVFPTAATVVLNWQLLHPAGVQETRCHFSTTAWGKQPSHSMGTGLPNSACLELHERQSNLPSTRCYEGINRHCSQNAVTTVEADLPFPVACRLQQYLPGEHPQHCQLADLTGNLHLPSLLISPCPLRFGKVEGKVFFLFTVSQYLCLAQSLEGTTTVIIYVRKFVDIRSSHPHAGLPSNHVESILYNGMECHILHHYNFHVMSLRRDFGRFAKAGHTELS